MHALALSPDGRRLAVAIEDKDADIWVYELERGIKTRLTMDGAHANNVAWTPSGEEIAYASSQRGNNDIFSKPSNGNGDAKLLVGTAEPEGAPDWSPDQRFLLYDVASKETKLDIVYRERRKDGSLGDPSVFLRTPFDEGAGKFSPDGRLVAYTSNESGRFEIYVRDFPNGKNRWQISANGGTAPLWRRDGKELYFAQGRKIMAVPVTYQPVFSPGAPAELFEQAARFFQPEYDVSADGKRFVAQAKPAGQQPLAVHVVHNWFEEFRGKPGTL
jgi:Tol biopolymer transport system component